jgi:hypothetical protein
MKRERLIEKIEKYIQYGRANNKIFNMAFCISKKSTPKTGRVSRRVVELAKVFSEYRNPFVRLMTVDLEELSKNPFGQVFHSLGNQLVSIDEMPYTRVE